MGDTEVKEEPKTEEKPKPTPAPQAQKRKKPQKGLGGYTGKQIG